MWFYIWCNIVTSGDNTVDVVGTNEIIERNLLKTILKASYSTFFKISSARTETWNTTIWLKHEGKNKKKQKDELEISLDG